MAEPPPLTTEDHFLIRELYARYAWATGTGDIEAFGDLFAPDAVMEDLGVRYEGGPDGARRFLRAWMDRGASAGRQHWVGQVVLDGNSEQCTSKAFAIVPHRNALGTPSQLIAWVGHYTDELVKVDGRWRFRQRLVERWEDDVLVGFPAYGVVEAGSAEVSA